VEKLVPGGQPTPGLLSRRNLFVAVIMGGLGLLIILLGLHFRIPGTGIVTDPREIFVTIGAALCGPVGGSIVGVFASLADPDPVLRLYVITSHLVGCLWIGWSYRRFVYPRQHIIPYLLTWNAVVFVYYFACALPSLFVVWSFFPDVFRLAFPSNPPLLDAIWAMNDGLLMEYVLTGLTTTVVFLVLPEVFRQPLWSIGGRGFAPPPEGAHEMRRILGLRLTVWFVLFSLMPIAIAALFVRGTLRTMLLEQRALGEMALVRHCANAVPADPSGMSVWTYPRALVTPEVAWAVLDSNDRYVAYRDVKRVGHPSSEDIPVSVLQEMRAGDEGFVEDQSTDRLVLYKRIQGRPLRFVMIRPIGDTFTAIRSFERTSVAHFTILLSVITLIAGVAIWLIIGAPMRTLALAVQRFGRGDRSVRVDTRFMTDEIQILGRSINEMTENISILHAGLEQEIRERRMAEHALRASEHKFHQMAELLPQPIFEADAAGRVTFANKSAYTTFGYGPDRLMAGISLLDVVSPDERPRVFENLRAVLIGEEKSGGEYMMRRADGVVFPALVYTGVVYDNDKAVGVRGIMVDITEQKRVAEVLRQALDEKEVLLKEVHHRVKNNLQIISSLLSLQADALNDPRDHALFKESEGRVRSMALIHERLYKSADLARVDFRDYVESLVTSLFFSYQRASVASELDVCDARLPLDTAIPCGLIINELVSNALKHAFPDERKGTVTISMREDSDGSLHLEVRDDGIGLPEEVDPETGKTLGLNLVSILTKQLQGVLDIERNGGTVFHVTFMTPIDEAPIRDRS
jgi:PAS domain S-box-containing protein